MTYLQLSAASVYDTPKNPPQGQVLGIGFRELSTPTSLLLPKLSSLVPDQPDC